jgi:hypothetical protein
VSIIWTLTTSQSSYILDMPIMGVRKRSFSDRKVLEHFGGLLWVAPDPKREPLLIGTVPRHAYENLEGSMRWIVFGLIVLITPVCFGGDLTCARVYLERAEARRAATKRRI